MGTQQISQSCTGRTAASSLLAFVGAGAILFTPALALAQGGADNGARAPSEGLGLLGNVTHWFDEQTSKLGSHFRGARSGVENLSHEAGVAAKSTVEGAKDAAGAVTRIPTTRVVTGREKCAVAPNGAPDCAVAANAICKTRGFSAGTSVDTTTAEICPPQAYMSGRTGGSDCQTETFVARALCQ